MKTAPLPCSDDSLQRVCRALAAGQVIAHPTETLFGLAVDPFHAAAVQSLLQLKGRQVSKGFILLIPDSGWLERLSRPPSLLAQRLMACFWPGPLTLALPARPELPVEITGGSGFVAVRHSSSPLVAALLGCWRGVLVSTSANLAGQPPALSAAAVARQWGDGVAVILAGEVSAQARPSTVLRLDDERVSLLREGALSLAQIRAMVPELEIET
ncbi:MAG: threonylcarbamoyl-AMP synthase [Magnetococcales bacterium]|nr:threonylcarbamoyl-AMP synthase [Magnetococcales bacterium]